MVGLHPESGAVNNPDMITRINIDTTGCSIFTICSNFIINGSNNETTISYNISGINISTNPCNINNCEISTNTHGSVISSTSTTVCTNTHVTTSSDPTHLLVVVVTGDPPKGYVTPHTI